MRFDPVTEEDKVIHRLDDEECKYLRGLINEYSLAENMKVKFARQQTKLEALQVLFWDKIMSSSEMAETAEFRGMNLSIKESGQTPVVVEIPQSQDFVE